MKLPLINKLLYHPVLRIVFIASWILLNSSSQLFAQTFQNAKRMGCDKAEDRGAAIVVDKQGNQ
jgi:hypothetical protein